MQTRAGMQIKKGYSVLLKKHLQQREGKQPRGIEEPKPTDTCLSQDRTSQRMRWGTVAKREFKMRPWESPTWIRLLPPWVEWPSGVPTWWPALLVPS